jgi:hypothetical protein
MLKLPEEIQLLTTDLSPSLRPFNLVAVGLRRTVRPLSLALSERRLKRSYLTCRDGAATRQGRLQHCSRSILPFALGKRRCHAPTGNELTWRFAILQLLNSASLLNSAVSKMRFQSRTGVPMTPGFFRHQPISDEETWIKGVHQLCRVNLFANYLVIEKIRFGRVPIQEMTGLFDYQRETTATTGFTTGTIDTRAIESQWQEVDSLESLAIKPILLLGRQSIPRRVPVPPDL